MIALMKQQQPTKVQWVAAKLKQIRLSRGLTLMQVANRMGNSSHSRVSDYEMSRYVPNMHNFFELLDALGTTPNDFFKDMPHLKEVGAPTRPSRAKRPSKKKPS